MSDDRKDLVDALREILGTPEDPRAGILGSGELMIWEFYCEHCRGHHKDGTKIQHTIDCPVKIARQVLEEADK